VRREQDVVAQFGEPAQRAREVATKVRVEVRLGLLDEEHSGLGVVGKIGVGTEDR
jgi:hypothetical protein